MRTIHYTTLLVLTLAIGSISIVSQAQSGYFQGDCDCGYSEEPGALDSLQRAPLTAEERAELLTWLEQYLPSRLADLQARQQEDPAMHEQELQGLADMKASFEELQRSDPEQFQRMIAADELEEKSWKLSQEIANTTAPDKKKEFTTQLLSLLDQMFEMRLQENVQEIQEVDAELQEMKTWVEKRKTLKSQIIERHLQELLWAAEDEEGLMGW